MHVCVVTEGFMLDGPASVLAELLDSWPNPDDQFTIVATRHSEPYRHLFTPRLRRPVEWARSPTLDRATLHQAAKRLRHPFRSENTVDVDRGNLGSAIVPPRWHWLGRLVLLLTQYPIFLWNVIRLTFLFRRLEPDILLINNGGYPGGDICRAAVVASGGRRAPRTLMVVHNLAERAPFWRWLPERLIDFIIDRRAQLIYVSPAVQSSLEESRSLRQTGIVIHNGYTPRHVSQLTREQLLIEFSLPPESYLISIVASYDPRKGHQVLFEAVGSIVGRFPQARVLAFGAGSESDTQRLQQLIQQHGLDDKAVLCGFRQDVTAYVGATDLLVLPSLEFELFPMAIIEATAMRTPVIASDVGGVGDLVENDVTGRLLPPGDTQALAEAIEQAIDQKGVADQWADAAYQQYLQTFTGDVMAQSYHRLLVGGE